MASNKSWLNPSDWLIYGMAYFSQFVMWLWIAISPTLILALIGLFCYAAFEKNGYYLLLGCIGVGMAIGVVWAEYVRRTYGCIEFMSKLLSTPEIDGRRTVEQQKRR
jgi:hypothetical protein